MPVEIKNSKFPATDNTPLEIFKVSLGTMKKIVKDFHSQMHNGLLGKESSLKMIPAYVDRPTGGELGKFIALDLGGTNIRILEIGLKGKGIISILRVQKFTLKKKHITGSQAVLFDFIARCIKKFNRGQKINFNERINLGFTFSFPVSQTGIAKGKLIHWTKDFSVRRAKGKDVVRLLKQALLRNGLNHIRIVALLNDTVGTLVTRAYKDRHCDIGVILGTGTNACYREKLSKISKWRGQKRAGRQMIINIEWGNFNQLPLTSFDRLLDKLSDNPGQQILEKMVSGMYLGEITRLILKDLIAKKELFKGKACKPINIAKAFKTEYMSKIEADNSRNSLAIDIFLKKLGIPDSNLAERKIVKKICQLVSRRAACIIAAVLAAVLTKMDPDLSKKHTIAIDGSLYEKYPQFSWRIKLALKELFKKKTAQIKIVLTKDGSGKGAAIIAALVS